MRIHQANGLGGLPLVGDPDFIATELANLNAAGFHEIAVSLVNYADELPYFAAEVLPRLSRPRVAREALESEERARKENGCNGA